MIKPIKNKNIHCQYCDITLTQNLLIRFIYFYNTVDPHWWYNEHAPLECGRLWVRAPKRVKPKTIKFVCFSAKHAALRRKSKDWWTRNQDNVFEWGDISIH